MKLKNSCAAAPDTKNQTCAPAAGMKLKNSCAAALCILMLLTAFTVCPAAATVMDAVDSPAYVPQYFTSAEYQASVPEEYKSLPEYLAFITEEYTPLPMFDISVSEVSASSSDVFSASDDVYSTVSPKQSLLELMKYEYDHGGKKNITSILSISTVPASKP